MKFSIFILIVGFLSVGSALICTTSSSFPGYPTVPPTNVSCLANVKYCMSVDLKTNGTEVKYQTCDDGTVKPDLPGLPKSCTATERKTIDATNTTGEYDCCNTDYCNFGITLNGDKKPDNSAIKPFAFGFASLFVIIALYF